VIFGLFGENYGLRLTPLRVTGLVVRGCAQILHVFFARNSPRKDDLCTREKQGVFFRVFINLEFKNLKNGKNPAIFVNFAHY